MARLALLSAAGACEPAHFRDEPLDVDAGDGSLALFADAGPADAKPAGPCFDDPKQLGAECPGVVSCTDRGLCDQAENICCIDDQSAFCDPRKSCGGVLRQLACDGSEDCAPGQVCCQLLGSTVCVPPEECSEGYRACHSDADCTHNRCLNGFPVPIGPLTLIGYNGIGFCRGK